MKAFLKFIIEPFLGARILQPFYVLLHRLALLGMNIGRGANWQKSGEMKALEFVATRAPARAGRPFILFDVGANVGEYTRGARSVLQGLGMDYRIHSFEPSVHASAQLREAVHNDSKVSVVQSALGAEQALEQLYSDRAASGLASLYNRKLFAKQQDILTEQVRVERLDEYCHTAEVPYIDFLKIDVEGGEFAVLRGARMLISERRIRAIQFEFGGTDIDARVFFRDFYELLSSRYDIYRILRSGLYVLSQYNERDEIFMTANFLAIQKDA